MNKVDNSIYLEKGYANRSEYLQSLEDEYGVDLFIIQQLAAALGPSEDFDGLVSQLEDMRGSSNGYSEEDF